MSQLGCSVTVWAGYGGSMNGHPLPTCPSTSPGGSQLQGAGPSQGQPKGSVTTACATAPTVTNYNHLKAYTWTGRSSTAGEEPTGTGPRVAVLLQQCPPATFQKGPEGTSPSPCPSRPQHSESPLLPVKRGKTRPAHLHTAGQSHEDPEDAAGRFVKVGLSLIVSLMTPRNVAPSTVPRTESRFKAHPKAEDFHVTNKSDSTFIDHTNDQAPLLCTWPTRTAHPLAGHSGGQRLFH